MSNGAGKGSRYRPVDQKKYAENYERIFGKPEKKKPSSRDECCFKFTCCDGKCDECLIGELIEATK